jgi:hypothetical protein
MRAAAESLPAPPVSSAARKRIPSSLAIRELQVSVRRNHPPGSPGRHVQSDRSRGGDWLRRNHPPGSPGRPAGHGCALRAAGDVAACVEPTFTRAVSEQSGGKEHSRSAHP